MNATAPDGVFSNYPTLPILFPTIFNKPIDFIGNA